jgi:hypothetical protein
VSGSSFRPAQQLLELSCVDGHEEAEDEAHAVAEEEEEEDGDDDEGGERRVVCGRRALWGGEGARSWVENALEAGEGGGGPNC